MVTKGDQNMLVKNICEFVVKHLYKCPFVGFLWKII
jgi:hypothetical protein